MKYDRKTKATRVLASLFAGILAVSSSTYAVANVRRSYIDASLGTSSYKVVTDAEASDGNLYGITAKQGKVLNVDGAETEIDCTTLEGLFAYEKDVAVRQAVESAVLLKNEGDILPLTGDGMNNITLLGSRSYAAMGEIEMWGMTRKTISGTQFGGNMGSIAPPELCVTIADALEGTSMVSNSDIRELVPFNHLRNSRADSGMNYWTNSGFEVDAENGVSGTASFKAEGVLGMTKSLTQTVYPASRRSYTFSAQIASEDLKKGPNGQVGIEVVFEYEDGSTETRFIDLF